MADKFFVAGPDAAQRRSLARDAATGKLRRLAPGLYTDNLRDPEHVVVLGNPFTVTRLIAAGAVLSGRSGIEAKPSAGSDGQHVFFLSDGKSRRSISLPGLELRFDGGPGPVEGDVPFLGIYLPSKARQVLENLVPSRARSGAARTLGQEAVERELEKVLVRDGEAGLNRLRDEARRVADLLNLGDEFVTLDRLAGALLGSREARLVSDVGRARAASMPFDPDCVQRLLTLRNHLESVAVPEVPDTSPTQEAREAASFVEAYFSNYIEGTRFLVEEARDIVFTGAVPPQRPRDGRDVLETYRQTVDLRRQEAPRALSWPELRDEIRSRHAGLMQARPEIGPGHFKVAKNAAGNTLFVDPTLVEGTLCAGTELLASVSHPFGRAVLIHFMLTDVHPFADGNGRLSRIMMTKELVGAGQSRIVVPNVHREDYVETLRMLSRDGNPEALVRCLAFMQRVTAACRATDTVRAIETWASTSAFLEASEGRLSMPDPTHPIEWRRGVPAPASHWREEDARKSGGIRL